MASDKDRLFEKIFFLAERLSIFLYWLRESISYRGAQTCDMAIANLPRS